MAQVRRHGLVGAGASSTGRFSFLQARSRAEPYGGVPSCMRSCLRGADDLAAQDELYQRVRRAAQQQGRSVNDYVTAVLDVATNPDAAGTEWEQLRQRLANTDLLVPPGAPRRRPNPDKVARARAAAGQGTSLSELVASSR